MERSSPALGEERAVGRLFQASFFDTQASGPFLPPVTTRFPPFGRLFLLYSHRSSSSRALFFRLINSCTPFFKKRHSEMANANVRPTAGALRQNGEGATQLIKPGMLPRTLILRAHLLVNVHR